MQPQKRISNVFILTIAILIALVLFGGFLVWQYLAASKQTTPNVVNNTPNNSEFKIPEVGLQFQLPSSLKDLTYTVQQQQNGTVIRFSTASLAAYGGDCANVPGTGNIGFISISQQLATGAIAIDYLITQPDFYVSYGSIQATCSSNAAAQNVQTQQVHALQDALKTLARTNQNTALPVGWKMYVDTQLGVSFEYPTVIQSSYMQFTSAPTVLKDPTLDASGCYVSPNDDGVKPDQITTIDGIPFCISEGGQGTAGTGYTQVDFTTTKNGHAYAIEFVIAEPDCGIIPETQQACQKDQSNFNTLVFGNLEGAMTTLQITQ
jgi:hypothetical protein